MAQRHRPARRVQSPIQLQALEDRCLPSGHGLELAAQLGVADSGTVAAQVSVQADAQGASADASVKASHGQAKGEGADHSANHPDPLTVTTSSGDSGSTSSGTSNGEHNGQGNSNGNAQKNAAAPIIATQVSASVSVATIAPQQTAATDLSGTPAVAAETAMGQPRTAVQAPEAITAGQPAPAGAGPVFLSENPGLLLPFLGTPEPQGAVSAQGLTGSGVVAETGMLFSAQASMALGFDSHISLSADEVPPSGMEAAGRIWTETEPLTLDATLPDEGASADLQAPLPTPEAQLGLIATSAPSPTALDQTLQQFLARLERLGGRLADPTSWNGLLWWTAAGAAAAGVWEVGRRRQVDAPDALAEGADLGWPQPERPGA